jgi:hypothetical protein
MLGLEIIAVVAGLFFVAGTAGDVLGTICGMDKRERGER